MILTKKQLDFLDMAVVVLGSWTLNEKTNLIDVKGPVNAYGIKHLKELPVHFGRVDYDNYRYSYFDCTGTGLQNLIGSPRFLNGNLIYRNCNIKSLEGAPDKIDGDFIISGETSEKGNFLTMLFDKMNRFHLTWEEALEKYIDLIPEKCITSDKDLAITLNLPENFKEKHRGLFSAKNLGLI